MFHSLSVLLFNTSEIERNLFSMADDVYQTIEIFEQAAKFEARIGRPFEMLSMIFDCLVFLAVALAIVALVLQKRFEKLWQLARLSHLREQTTNLKKINKKETLPVARSSSVTSLPEVNAEPEDDGISIPKDETSDKEEDNILEQKNMFGTSRWARNWRVSMKIQNFGSFYDTWFR
ncbi:uncharacterized protein [Drosophila kikkawai]|uniref:Uncharacterized protein n=1 Tax=Drosophila kikkawai TaxID=30033 RepID=A0A6P4JM90_DROKI|nr:uncharacterized protein LOC108084906 [Drosophila kikkawai]